MEVSRSTALGFSLAFILGVAVGGFGVAQIIRAIPKMMSNIMLAMVSQMGGAGYDLEEMWRKMMSGFVEIPEIYE